MTGQVIEYAVASSLEHTDGIAELSLGTSGGSWLGDSASPVFFDGVVERAGPVATAMLVLARVAATRFYMPPNMVAAILRRADPVFTSTPDGLRLEAFSPCAGVYARFDLDAGVADVQRVTSGVTNVDFNEGMRSLLSGVAAGEPMHLSVAGSGVTVHTLDGSEVEAKVPLPERWIRSFAESQVLAAGSDVRAEPEPAEVRRLVRDLPRTTPTGSVGWVQPVARGIRLGTRPSAGAVGLAGPERLRLVEPLLPAVTSVRVFAGDGASSFWEFTTPRGRLTVGFSAHKSRGFSGEGGLLETLATADADRAADVVLDALRFDSRLDLQRLAASTGLPVDQVRTGITVLAAQGLVGFDTGTGAWFHRPLPYDAGLTERLHPRLASANALADAVVASGDGSYRVGDYRVRIGTPAGDTCTCAWWGRHRGDRGPCKHVLAVRMREASA